MSNEIWNKIFTQKEWGRYPSENLIKFIAKNFYHLKRSEINILEIGCGPGANIWYLSREGFISHGIDISSVAIPRFDLKNLAKVIFASLSSSSPSNLNNSSFKLVMSFLYLSGQYHISLVGLLVLLILL